MFMKLVEKFDLKGQICYCFASFLKSMVLGICPGGDVRFGNLERVVL